MRQCHSTTFVHLIETENSDNVGKDCVKNRKPLPPSPSVTREAVSDNAVLQPRLFPVQPWLVASIGPTDVMAKPDLDHIEPV